MVASPNFGTKQKTTWHSNGQCVVGGYMRTLRYHDTIPVCGLASSDKHAGASCTGTDLMAVSCQ